MKRLLLPFFLFTVFVCRSQSYIPMAENIVIYGLTHRVLSMGDEYWDPVRTEINNDTLIGSYNYAIVYSGVSPVIRTGGIRNDIPNKKVYFYSFTSGTEKLLYDFDLSVGDTVNASSGYGFYDPLVTTQLPTFATLDTAWVTSIDSVYMAYDGLYHRRFWFNGLYCPGFMPGTCYLVDTTDSPWTSWPAGGTGSMVARTLVEGVGQLYNPVSEFGEFEYSYSFYVWCSSVNGVPVVTPPSGAPPPFINSMYCDQLYVGLNEAQKGEIIFYPNPAYAELNIESAMQIQTVSVIDLMGRDVSVKEIKSANARIDVGNLPAGMYTVRITNSEGQITNHKIIKQ